MSVTLRLEGLSNRASSDDIRKFFVGLDIPQGGVHILGGSNGEAFVDVATWDNAYQALQLSGLQIKDSMVTISVTSSEEKQQALENSHKVKDSAPGKNGAHEKKSNKSSSSRSCMKYFLRLEISEFAPTTADIKHFFDGVQIKDMVFSKDEESPGKVIVIIMFANKDDAYEGFYRYKDSKIIRIRWAGMSEWKRHGGKIVDEDDGLSSTSGNSRKRTHSRSPQKYSRSSQKRSRSPRSDARSPQSNARSPRSDVRSSRSNARSPRSDVRSSRSNARSPRSDVRSPRSDARSPRSDARSPRSDVRSSRSNARSPRSDVRSSRSNARSPKRYSRSPLSSSRTPLRYSRSPEERDSKNPKEYHVQLTNLSYRAKRDDIKKLFHNCVRDDHIVFVYDERGHRTREGFATFTRWEHFRKALGLHKAMFKGHQLSISGVSKSDMQKLLWQKGHSSGNYNTYLHLRNFPPDVSKSDVKQFLEGFSLNEDDIFLLCDKNNTCLGDILVKFSSLEIAFRAEKLDGTMFKDKQISLQVVHEYNLTSFLDSNGFHMVSADLNDCVTQEDDPSEDEVSQENDTCDDDDEPITQAMDTPEEECTVQKDTTPECVSQADD